MKCYQIMEYLEKLSPKEYACDWDNVGLLVGRKEKEIKRIMVALDATKEVVQKAVDARIDMLITHHPMIFSSLKQINEGQFVAEKVLSLAENGICYYAMHTNFDAVGGMAELVAGEQYLGLTEVAPITSCGDGIEGMGRYGKLPHSMTAEEVAEYVKQRFGLSFVMLYQSAEERFKKYDRLAVLPGSGKSELKTVKQAGYDLYLTGDFGHHEGLDAIDMGMAVIDATHYGLEHIFAEYIMHYLENVLSQNAVELIKADMGCPIQII